MNNEPAFPNPRWEGWGDPQAGMTLRDYFAAKAMQGLISCPEWRENAGEDIGMDASEYTAHTAYEMANAMMEARK